MADDDKKKAAEAAAARQREQYIQGLRSELEGYQRAGREDRVAQVQAELERVGGKTPRGRQQRD